MNEVKCFGIIIGKSKVEFSVWKVAKGYEARVNDIVIYRSESYSACSDAIDGSLETNVFNVSGAVH